MLLWYVRVQRRQKKEQLEARPVEYSPHLNILSLFHVHELCVGLVYIGYNFVNLGGHGVG